ncbi:hypothetical protein Tco_0880285 [Tanacetum coccineum]
MASDPRKIKAWASKGGDNNKRDGVGYDSRKVYNKKNTRRGDEGGCSSIRDSRKYNDVVQKDSRKSGECEKSNCYKERVNDGGLAVEKMLETEEMVIESETTEDMKRIMCRSVIGEV